MAGTRNSFILESGRRFRVVETMVSVRLISGRWVDLHRHNKLPADASPSHIEHLLANGLIREEGA